LLLRETKERLAFRRREFGDTGVKDSPSSIGQRLDGIDGLLSSNQVQLGRLS